VPARRQPFVDQLGVEPGDRLRIDRFERQRTEPWEQQKEFGARYSPAGAPRFRAGGPPNPH
jgi:hypothetical protein